MEGTTALEVEVSLSDVRHGGLQWGIDPDTANHSGAQPKLPGAFSEAYSAESRLSSVLLITLA